MKFIWEESDINSDRRWGLLAKNEKETVILGGKSKTSLRDGCHWEYESSEKLVENLNKYGYRPVMSPVNASLLIGELEERQFNYGKGLGLKT